MFNHNAVVNQIFFFSVDASSNAFGVVSCGDNMALPAFEDVLSECGVDPTLASQLVQEGWTSQNFAMVVNSKEEFNEGIWDQLCNSPISLVQRSNLKVAWQQLQPDSTSTSRDSNIAGMPTASAPEGSWSESFAPKLQANTVSKLKKQFLEDYPSEALAQTRCPVLDCFRWRFSIIANVSIHGSLGVIECHNPKWMIW